MIRFDLYSWVAVSKTDNLGRPGRQVDKRSSLHAQEEGQDGNRQVTEHRKVVGSSPTLDIYFRNEADKKCFVDWQW
jgi:hypothetical protein